MLDIVYWKIYSKAEESPATLEISISHQKIWKDFKKKIIITNKKSPCFFGFVRHFHSCGFVLETDQKQT